MALAPHIDQPCPLGIDEQRRLTGHCGRCDKHVHALDGMDEGARRALLAGADGPICVSYRRSARFAHVAAIAITLVAGTALASEDCADSPGAPMVPAVTQGPVSPVPASGALAPADPAQPAELTELDFIVVGGISAPGDAEWVDESDLPELPVIPANMELGAVEPQPAAASPAG